MFKPSGIYAAMLTPFQSDGGINEPVIRRMVDFMIANGVQGIFAASSVGEFVHMSVDEVYKMVEVVLDQARGRVPVLAGVGSTCTETSIKMARQAEKMGCDGVVACPPYYYPACGDNLSVHFEAIASAVNIPIVLYNIPLFSSPIPQSVGVSLSKITNIVAIKDSSGSMVDLMHYIEQVRHLHTDFNILTGREDMLAPALQVGAAGSMTASACIVPEVMAGIWHAYQDNNWDKMLRLQNALLPLLRLMFEVPFPIGFKTALELRGFEMGPLKQVVSTPEVSKVMTVKAKLKTALQELLDFSAHEGIATDRNPA